MRGMKQEGRRELVGIKGMGRDAGSYESDREVNMDLAMAEEAKRGPRTGGKRKVEE